MEKRVAGGFWPLGVFCVNDLYARHVVGCCHTHGIQMPEQVAVVGVNNSEVAGQLAEIPFSSVELQIEKIGYEAARLLAGMMDGEQPPAEPVLIQPKGVVVRQSSDLMAVNDAAVARALRLIRENALKQIDIGQIVLKVGISRRLLEMRFRAATGRSPYAEVVRLRVEKAKSLLATGDLPVSEVAEASGFGQAKQLHAIFTRETGMAPSLYRRLYRQPPTSP
jgi:LacI family transcriptional regulator